MVDTKDNMKRQTINNKSLTSLAVLQLNNIIMPNKNIAMVPVTLPTLLFSFNNTIP